MKIKEKPLSSIDKVAVVLLSMGDEFIAETFTLMDRQEVADISKAIVNMRNVSQDEVSEIIREFHTELIYSLDAVTGGKEVLKKLLSKTVDTDTAKYISDILQLNTGIVPFKNLANVSVKMLTQVLRDEHPQTLALVLAHLPRDKAADVLSQLPEGLKVEVTKRLATLEPVPEEILLDVDKALQTQIIAMGGTEGRHVGGISTVAEILNATDKATEEVVLAEIEEENPQMAIKIRNLMFVFENILDIDDRGIREILKEIDSKELLLALRSTSEELKNKIFTNMSQRASKMLIEDMEVMGPAKLTDIEEAQQNILKIIRRLEEEGKVIISRGGGDVFI
ncbi:MAG: flagellar motor switch protein FliG [Desulfovibrionaceae bacterium]